LRIRHASPSRPADTWPRPAEHRGFRLLPGPGGDRTRHRHRKSPPEHAGAGTSLAGALSGTAAAVPVRRSGRSSFSLRPAKSRRDGAGGPPVKARRPRVTASFPASGFV